jgi:hypothetical protein
MLKNIKAISSKCNQHCKCCKIYCFVTQALNSYVAPHTDSQSGDQAISQYSKAVFVKIKALSQVYFGFNLKNFPEPARHVPHCHLVQPM